MPRFKDYKFKDRVVFAPFELRFYKLAQADAMLWADELYRNDDPSSIRRARELFKGVIFLHGEDPDIEPDFVPQFGYFPPVLAAGRRAIRRAPRRSPARV